MYFLFILIPRPLKSTLFPYTTLFRSKVQSSRNKLSSDQVAALIANGGVLTSGGFSEPQAIDFNDHTGYVSLFDGNSLKDWDRSEEHTSELQSHVNLVCRLLLEKKK